MELTIEAYRRLIELLRSKSYPFCFYHDADDYDKSVILRHDVDFTLSKAVEMAEVEHEMGVKSTYFILVTADFYNIFSKRSYERLIKILSLGHEIGLHFDEKRYEITTVDEMKKYVEMEAELLSKYLNNEVKVVSMHRPSKLVLENDIQFDQLINSYSTKYFKSMKYISDSRLHWRENPVEIIESGKYKKLHILTHPFSYSVDKKSMEAKLKDFIIKAIDDRYLQIDENFTALEQVIRRDEI